MGGGVFKEPTLEDRVQVSSDGVHFNREFMCGLMKRQETALDQIEIEITATPNLPVEVYTVGRYLDSFLKGMFIEYITQLPNFQIRDMHGVKMVIKFDQRLEALNLKITSPPG